MLLGCFLAENGVLRKIGEIMNSSEYLFIVF